MRISLGLRILTLIATINVLVFGAGLYFLTGQINADRLKTQQDFAERLLYTLGSSFNERGELRVEQILRWPYWDAVPDAVIVDSNPDGVFLNPVGALARDAYFDRELIEASLEQAIATSGGIPAMGGFAMPISDNRGGVWGGCWFRVDPVDDPVWKDLMPWFFITTILLYLGTFFVLRRYVIQPVQELASGARRLAAAEVDVHLDVPGHSDELTDLIHTFNNMASDLHRYRAHLEDEVEVATRKAYEAEAAAMRQRRLAAMGELAAGIAHEINNPLGGMLNAVEVLERDSTSPEKRSRYHSLLQGGLERIQGTVAKLLRFTPRQGSREPLDLRGPIQDAVELVQHRIRKQHVGLELALTEEPCLVSGQRSELGQAVLNLLVNALDALEDQKGPARVSVSLQRRNGEVVIEVADNGPGVHEDQLERVADLFYTTKDVGRGTGLGLALVHTVVHDHGGHVHLENSVEGGLRVELRLPAG